MSYKIVHGDVCWLVQITVRGSTVVSALSSIPRSGRLGIKSLALNNGECVTVYPS